MNSRKFPAIQLHLLQAEAEHPRLGEAWESGICSLEASKTVIQKLGMNQNLGSNFTSLLSGPPQLREFHLLICVETGIDRAPSQVADSIF